jgi:hypothetical protein
MKIIAFLYLSFLPFACNGEDIKVTMAKNDISLHLTIEEISTTKDRTIQSNGFSTWEGKIYRTNYQIPFNILKNATLTFGKSEIALPTSGIADCFHKDIQMGPENLFSQSIGNGLQRIGILFDKGGAEDFVVYWIVSSNSAILDKIVGCGDSMPEWYQKDK